MKVMGIPASRFWKFAAGFVFLFSSFGSIGAQVQAPYMIPYTISTIAGGGTAPTIGEACSGVTGTTPTAEDTLGDGCPANSAYIVSALDLHDVGIDPLGNIIFIDNEGSAIIRRIDVRSGIVNVLAGSVASTKVCTNATDAYGDGCPANDGKGNAAGGYTGNIAKCRGIAVAKNGDVYLADYNESLVHKISASTGYMTLVAGTIASNKGLGTTGGYTGDGTAAVGADLSSDRGVGVDAAGNVYIADTTNNVIRVVYGGGTAVANLITADNPGVTTPTVGYIYTIVGKNPNTGATTGPGAHATAGSTGDGGPAAAALLSAPEDVEIDGNGNLFIGDFGNNKIRVVYAGGSQVANLIKLTNGGALAQAGSIYTVVGGGAATYTPGTIVLATSILSGTSGFNSPRKLSLDAHGNIYIADNTNDIVWFVDAATGYMRTIAGMYGKTTNSSTCTTTDALGDNCQATLATFSPNSAMGIGIGPQGDVYISDAGDARIRKIALNTTFPAVASGSSATQTLLVHFAAADGPATASPFTFAGSPDFAVSGTPVCTTNSSADNTTDCTVSVVFTPARPGLDTASFTVKSALGQTAQYELNGTGTASSVALDPGNTALIDNSFSTHGGIAQDGAGNTYVADTGNNRVVEYLAGSTTPTPIAGTGASSYSGDGAAATSATLKAPKAIAITPDGAVYIADTGNNVIRRVDPVTGFISTFAGGGTVCASNVALDSLGDGCPATSAKFSAPSGLVSDSIGNLYVSDTGNNVIRELSTSGYVFLIAGGASAVCPSIPANPNATPPILASGPTDIYGNGCAPTSAIFNSPTALQIDNARNLYIADTGNNEVRKITAATNLVSLFAGTGQAGDSGNGGAANTAAVNGPTGLALDAAANLYIADTGNHVVRVVNASGDISTVIGTLGSSGTGTVGTVATPVTASSALLNLPAAVVASGIGKLTILDSGNNRLLSLDRNSISVNFGRTNDGASSPTTTIQETATGSATANLGYPLFSPGNTALFTLASYGYYGCSSSSSTPQTLAPGVSCNLSAQFFPPVSSIANAPYSATFTEQNATTLNTPAITLSGTGAILTATTLTTAVTTPPTGNPQYPNSFTVTATLHLAKCDPTKTNCAPDFTAAGTITFSVNGVQVGSSVSVSNSSNSSSNVITAAAVINGLNAGTYTLTAVYSGDTYYASTTSPTLPVSVAKGATLTVTTPPPSSNLQFTNLTLSSQVTSATSTIPTGSVTFYAGTTLLGSASLNLQTGIATLPDVFTTALTKTPTNAIGDITNVPQSFGLNAGTYNLTAVYSGDSNYAISTSAGVPLVITADPQAFAIAKCLTTNVNTGCTPAAVGTAQGSTAQSLIYIIPSNTLNGTLTFSCSGLPANSVCTFSASTTATQPDSTQLAGSVLIFTPVAGSAVPGTTTPGAALVGGAIAVPAPPLPQSLTVTLWTDVNPNVNSASNTPRSRPTLAGLLGWPMLLGGFAGVFGFRKRLRNTRLLTVLAFFALLSGSAMVMTGCTAPVVAGPTPVGSYTVTLTVTGPNGLVQTTTIPFTVGAGIAGQS
jgi:sugar lactone lactonase YvrE